MIFKRYIWAGLLVVSTFCIGFQADAAKQQKTKSAKKQIHEVGRLQTRWFENVTPENAHREYPRPQFERKEWMSLNGHWDYAIVEHEESEKDRYHNIDDNPLQQPVSRPAQWDGKILVPFSAESKLGGVNKVVGANRSLWYTRKITIPKAWAKQRIKLNFGSVDWFAKVWVNGEEVGTHSGGYDPFSLDITTALIDEETQEITVAVWDPTDLGRQPHGKQIGWDRRYYFSYTSTTGIWKPVWIEPVSDSYLEHLKITPDLDKSAVVFEPAIGGDKPGATITYEIYDGSKKIASLENAPCKKQEIKIKAPKLWSPDSPFLYDVIASLKIKGETVDTVKSYVGMRKISLHTDENGMTRMVLNNKPLFQLGPLDQGYWPESQLTPPSDEATQYDLDYLKSINCNMVRVHLKTHPERWYYWCDKKGLLVWQDFITVRSKTNDKSERERWEDEQRRMMDALYNHPSIIMWVIFNEAKNQFDTERVTNWVMEKDPSRLANSASGWKDYGTGQIFDIHDYSHYVSIPHKAARTRAAVAGEGGGYDLHCEEHMWEDILKAANETYEPLLDNRRPKLKSLEELKKAYPRWAEGLRLMVPRGLDALVYTQTSDVEAECNGWLTYDRELSKIPVDELAAYHAKIFVPPANIKQLISPTATFKYTHSGTVKETTAPADPALVAENASGSQWKNGSFKTGDADTFKELVPGSSEQSDKYLYIQVPFKLTSIPEKLAFDATGRGSFGLYINGKLAQQFFNCYTRPQEDGGTVYSTVSSLPLHSSALEHLRKGKNTLTIVCAPAGNRGGTAYQKGEKRLVYDLKLYSYE